jgi:hypothetical protein
MTRSLGSPDPAPAPRLPARSRSFRTVGRLVVAERHAGHDPLARKRIVGAEGHRLRHARSREEHLVDLLGLHVDAPADDQVLATTHDPVEAFRVTDREIARPEPALAQSRFARGGVAQVAAQEVGTPHLELTLRGVGQQLALLPDDARLAVDGSAHAAHADLGFLRAEHRQHRGDGHEVRDPLGVDRIQQVRQALERERGRPEHASPAGEGDDGSVVEPVGVVQREYVEKP